jgi:hypothetical protein
MDELLNNLWYVHTCWIATQQKRKKVSVPEALKVPQMHMNIRGA